MRFGLFLGLLAACAGRPRAAHAPAAPATIASFEKPAISVSPSVVILDPKLQERGPAVHDALAKALREAGFAIEHARLAAKATIDYAPITAITPGSVVFTVRIEAADGVGVDEVSVQRVNETFPEDRELQSICEALAKQLAGSPRLAKWVTERNASPVAP